MAGFAHVAVVTERLCSERAGDLGSWLYSRRLAHCAADPLLPDGDGKWRDLPIVVARALRPFPQATGRAAALQNTLQLGLCFFASLVVSWLIITPLLTTTSVMLAMVLLAALGYGIQHRADEEQDEVREPSSARG